MIIEQLVEMGVIIENVGREGCDHRTGGSRCE